MKLSQQGLQSSTIRPTRTQRVFEQQEEARQRVLSLAEFERLKSKATEIQQAEFSNITSIDEYEQKYNLLDPSMKQFFASPQQLRQEQTERIQTNLQKVQEKISYSEQKKQELYERYKSVIAYYQKRRSEDPKQEEKYSKLEREAEYNWSENEAYWNSYLEGLKEGLGKLGSNQDISYGDIQAYADDLGESSRSREGVRAKEQRSLQQQKINIKQLEEQGYKPILIQEYDKGKIQKESISFYNPEKVQYAKLSVPLSTNLKNISSLEASQLGRTPITRTLGIGTGKYQFKTYEKLYVEPSGKLTTQFGGISEKTESAIISEAKAEAQATAIQEWEKERATKKSYESEVQTEPPIVDDRKWYEKSLQELIIQPTKTKVSAGFQKIKKAPKYISDIYPDVPIYITPLKIKKLGGIGGGLEIIPITKGATKISDITGIASQKLQEKEQKKFGELLGTYGIKEKVDIEIQEEAQQKFEDIYYKDIVSEKISFEEAKKEFEQSKEVEYLNQKYADRITEETRNIPQKSKIISGVQMAGLRITRGLVDIVPTTVGEAGVTAGAVVIGVSALKYIPPHVSNIATGGIGVSGLSKTLSKKSTPIEAGTGVITAGVSFGILGIQGIKYLRQPTVKAIKIESPRVTLKATESVGRDIKILTDKGVINKVVYQEQKLAQVGIAGRRTVVSTKWRDILGLDPIYKGIPSAQKGVTYSLQSFRGTTLYTTESGYQKAFKLLTKRGGYTPIEATKTLRYYQPKVIEQYLMKGIITVKGEKAVGHFTYLTKQPVIDIDKALGVQTRGARTIKKIFNVERQLTATRTGRVVAIEKRLERTFILPSKSTQYLEVKLPQVSKNLIVGQDTELKRGYDLLKSDIKGIKIFKEIGYRKVGAVTFKGVVWPKPQYYQAKDVEIGETKLINKMLDLRTKEEAYFTFTKTGPKTPFYKTFGSPTTVAEKNLIVRETKIAKYGTRGQYGTGGQNVEQIISQSNKLQQAENILKTPIAPPRISLKTQIKNLVGVQQSYGTFAGVGLGLSALSTIKAEQKYALIPKLDVKNIIKTSLKEEVIPKTDTGVKSGIASILRSVQAPIKEPPLLSPPPIKTPPFKLPPEIPEIPKMIFPFKFPSAKLDLKRKLKSRKIQEFAYLPDFTARALGLKPEIISEKEAQRKLKKILTGFEIRRPIKIKY